MPPAGSMDLARKFATYKSDNTSKISNCNSLIGYVQCTDRKYFDFPQIAANFCRIFPEISGNMLTYVDCQQSDIDDVPFRTGDKSLLSMVCGVEMQTAAMIFTS